MDSAIFRLRCSFRIRVIVARDCESLEARSSSVVMRGLIDRKSAVLELARVVSVMDFEDGAPDLESMSICSELSRDSSMIGVTRAEV